MKLRTAFVLTAGLLGTLLFAAPALAQHGPGGPPMRARHGLGPAAAVLHSLDLTDEQRTKLHSIVRGYHDGEIENAVAAVAESRRALELRVWDPNANEVDLAEATGRLGESQRALNVLRHRMASEILGVLTDEQRTTFQTKLAEMPEAMDMPGPGFHRRHGAPDGGPHAPDPAAGSGG